LPLVGLGQLHGVDDQATLSRGFQRACQPWHDNRGVTGYLSYTFTMPKELSLLAEGHPARARQAMYAALQATLNAAFPNKSLKAVATVHARNEAGEVHYHAHVLIGKFARDVVLRRVYSLNSRSGGNTGKDRVAELKRAWKQNLDAELHRRLGVAVAQPAPFAAPTLTLRAGQEVEPLTRQSRRILDKFLCQQLSRKANADGTRTPAFRWTRMDATIYELAASPKAGGWNARAFCELFPELAKRLKMYEARVATLKRISYLDDAGKLTPAFTLHFDVHTGDRPELRRLLADLQADVKRARSRGDGEKGGGPSPARTPAIPPAPSPSGETARDPDADLWLAFHRRQQFTGRLERLDLSTDAFRTSVQAFRRSQPTPALLASLRQEARDRPPPLAPRAAQPRPGIIRTYVELQGARVVTTFMLAKGVMTLTPLESAALARRMLEQARRNHFMAKEQLLATTARRMRPLAFLGRLAMPADFERLDLALRRCSGIPSTSQWGHLFQRQMARAYRNSRESLQAQLRAEQSATARTNPAAARGVAGREEQLLARESRAPGGGNSGRHGSAGKRYSDRERAGLRRRREPPFHGRRADGGLNPRDTKRDQSPP
jgi:hypothetical protein